MEFRGNDDDDRMMTRDFLDWERLAAELPEAYVSPSAPPGSPSGHDEEVVVPSPLKNIIMTVIIYFYNTPT